VPTIPARLSPGRNQNKASVVLCMEAESSTCCAKHEGSMRLELLLMTENDTCEISHEMVYVSITARLGKLSGKVFDLGHVCKSSGMLQF